MRLLNLSFHSSWLSGVMASGALLLLVFTGSSGAKTIFVNRNAVDPVHDGTTWATAYLTVQEGLTAAVSGDEVWVAKSSPAAAAYYESITLKAGVALYGGFSGAESSLTERNRDLNVTILDGNAGYIVSSSAQQAVMDGFMIRNGLIGFYQSDGSSTFANCTFSANQYGHYISKGTVNLIECEISGNAKAGIEVYNGTVTLANCDLFANAAKGINTTGGTVNIAGCRIFQNVYGVYSAGGVTNVVNSTFNSNSFGVYATFGTLTATNCTISGNNQGVTQAGGTITLANSIVSACGKGLARHSESLSLTLTSNNVFGNALNFEKVSDPTGTNGNISVDPMLSNPYHDVHLQPGSLCIDAGNNALVQSGWTDIDGQARVQGDRVDIGSDESDGTTWTVPANTWYVRPTGDDTNDGLSWATAKKTISGGLAAAFGPDEVWVAQGVYTENIAMRSGLRLYGGFSGTETTRDQRNWKTYATILDGAAKDVVQVGHNAVLDGFTVRNGARGVTLMYGDTSIANCVVTGNSTTAIHGSGGATSLTDCTVTNNSYHGLYLDFGTATVTRCEFRANGWDGINAHLTATLNVTDSLVNGNTRKGILLCGGYVVNCTDTGNGTGIEISPDGVNHVLNSIIAFNGTGINRFNNCVIGDISCNDVYGNTSVNYGNMTDQTDLNGNISADPLFVNRSGGDYRLQATSPCADTGIDSTVVHGQTDYAGLPRIVGAHVDMGAHEYAGRATSYVLPEAVEALRIAAGLKTVSAGYLPRLDLETDGSIRIPDAARIARKVAGTDTNP